MGITNANKMANAENAINNLTQNKVKFIKKEKGLMEREENDNKVILVEDNRQILLG